MMRALTLLFLLFTAAAHAQLPIFSPDDFIDPRATQGRVVFISRLVAGGARGYTDQYRDLGQDVAYVHVANSLYWSGFQAGYEHSEIRGSNDWSQRRPERQVPPVVIQQCDPTPISPPICANATFPTGTASKPVDVAPRDAVQLSWYHSAGDRLMLRYQASYSRQYALPELPPQGTVTPAEDHDDTRGAQLDAAVRIGSRTFSGTASVTELTRASAIARTKTRAVTLTAFLPLVRVGPAILTPRVQFGRISGEEGTPSIDLITPSLDLALNIPRTRTNVHVVYSPLMERIDSGRQSQRTTHHQLAVYVDRALIVAVFGRK
jgi:hypothetical protein